MSLMPDPVIRPHPGLNRDVRMHVRLREQPRAGMLRSSTRVSSLVTSNQSTNIQPRPQVVRRRAPGPREHHPLYSRYAHRPDQVPAGDLHRHTSPPDTGPIDTHGYDMTPHTPNTPLQSTREAFTAYHHGRASDRERGHTHDCSRGIQTVPVLVSHGQRPLRLRLPRLTSDSVTGLPTHVTLPRLACPRQDRRGFAHASQTYAYTSEGRVATFRRQCGHSACRSSHDSASNRTFASRALSSVVRVFLGLFSFLCSPAAFPPPPPRTARDTSRVMARSCLVRVPGLVPRGPHHYHNPRPHVQ